MIVPVPGRSCKSFLNWAWSRWAPPWCNTVHPSSGIQVAPARIRETRRIIDDLVTPELFSTIPELIWLGDTNEEQIGADIFKSFLVTWKPKSIHELERRQVPLPEVEVQYFPSNPRGHVVVRDTPIEAWKEVLYLLTRFGHRVTLKKGDRLELQHVKVVVEKPEFEAEKKLHEVNLDSRETAALPGRHPPGRTPSRRDL